MMPTFAHRTSYKLLTILCASLLLTVFSACRSYNLGYPGALEFETVYIQAVGNESFAPQAQALVSSNLREAFIRDGRIKVVSSEDAADVVLVVTLTEYTRSPGSFSNVDSARAFDFDINLQSQIGLFDPTKGQYLIENERVEASTNAYTENPYTAAGAPNTRSYLLAESQAMVILSRSLSQKIADRVLSAWQ